MGVCMTILKVIFFIPLLLLRLVASICKKFLKFSTDWIFQETIVFNCVWEDPHIDKVALELEEDKSVVCTITSAGCNVLSLALEKPKQIHSIDRNPCQNALLELKIAAIRELEYDQFWQMFGKGRMENFTKIWYPRLRPHLSAPAKEFWDKRSYYFDGPSGILRRKSFYFYGSSGILAWFFSKIYFRLVPGLSTAMNDLIHAESLEQQKDIYENRLAKKLWNPVIMWLFSSKTTLALLNGVPGPQAKLLEEESGYDTVIDFIKANLEVVLTTLPLKDNYFWRVYLEDGQYTKDCCPDYLIEENFNALRDGLVDRISIHTCTIEEFLDDYNEQEGSAPIQDIDRYILLDHMDWMSTSPKLLKSEWDSILEHATDDVRFLWRSASAKCDFVLETPVEWKGEATTVGDLLKFDTKLAEDLHKRDRVHTYTSFFIGDINTDEESD